MVKKDSNQKNARCVVCGGEIVETSLAVSVRPPGIKYGGHNPPLPGTAKIYHCADCKLVYAEPPPESAHDKIAAQR